jgi:hypothetical protein
VLLGPVVADGVDADDGAVERELDRAGDDGHLDELTGPGLPVPVGRAGEGFAQLELRGRVVLPRV